MNGTTTTRKKKINIFKPPKDNTFLFFRFLPATSYLLTDITDRTRKEYECTELNRTNMLLSDLASLL